MGDKFWSIDWQGIFTPAGSLLEMVVRGTVMYLLVFVLLRHMLKRQIGGIGPSDVLVIVLLAEVSGPAFTADYQVRSSPKAPCSSPRCCSGLMPWNGWGTDFPSSSD